MDTLAYILNKYNLGVPRRSPIEIPNMGRDNLPELFHELGFKVGAEIGTEEGNYAYKLCKHNPGVKLFCVDMWQNYPGYRDYKGKEDKLINAHDKAVDTLKHFDVTFIQKYSMDAVMDFEDGSLDFVYIDANHEWPYITHDIYYWSPKVRPGGIVSGHDYYISTRSDSRCHVKGAVGGYTYSFRIHPWFIIGRNAKIEGEIRDNSRSWFWVRDERPH